MAPESEPHPSRSRLSLYANLLDPSSPAGGSPGTISGAPVLYGRSPSVEDKIAKSAENITTAASLRFQPPKRPLLSTSKSKAKSHLPKQAQSILPLSDTVPHVTPDKTAAAKVFATKSTIADWTTEGDDANVNGLHQSEKRQRGGRKRRKKNKEETTVIHNWDDIYDPSRPNNYEDYKNSDEKMSELREWKDKLYAHRMARENSNDSGSSEDESQRQQSNRQFPPPPSFAAPTNPKAKSDVSPSAEPRNVARVEASSIFPLSLGEGSPPLSGIATTFPIAQPSEPPPSSEDHGAAPFITRAPVRYNLPAAPVGIPTTEAGLVDLLQNHMEDSVPNDATRSLRPGQQDFAKRLMNKYGWNKGSGLGASGSGIINPLTVKMEKQRKKPDSEGGGFAGPGGMGKIIGGKIKSSGADASVGKFGVMSEVILLRGMVDGMDLETELAGGDGGLMQEIGEECGEKYGRVERVFIDRSNYSRPLVFIRFTSQLSALRAVNALEGRMFNGNTITAMFFDAEKFERGEYDSECMDTQGYRS